MLAALRPKPFRGEQVAAGAVVLTTLVGLLDTRFDDRWGGGVLLAITVLAAAFVGVMAASSPMEGAAPRGYQSVLFLAGLALVLLALVRLSDVLGSDGGAGTFFWVAATLSGAAFWLAGARNSAAC